MSEEYKDIKPYTDEEASKALERVSRHIMTPVISKYLFPELPSDTLRKMLKGIKSVDDFQKLIMSKAIGSILYKTSDGFTYSGIENLLALDGGKFLAVSNHRDIILDPALTQYTLFQGGIPLTEICVGNNLLSSQLVEDLMRSNRMITVIRGITARQLYLSSKVLSSYIRDRITGGKSSVWIAQREGRTKDGRDSTEQGLLKMFDMSGEKGFFENFKELNVVPLSISYEYEPCDAKKARELLIKERNGGKYRKRKGEDLHSILTGVKQAKGHIHLHIGAPLTDSEIEKASLLGGNERYHALMDTLDRRIHDGYMLYKTNYMAYDLLNGGKRYSSRYSDEELEKFKAYVEHKLGKVERRYQGDRLREIFLGIYANPV